MKPHWKIVKKQIGLLHVAKADLIARGVLDEAGYRELLGQFKSGGQPVASSKDLTNAQFDELMEHFKKCGFVYRPRAKSSKFKVQGSRLSAPTAGKYVHLEAIGAILDALGKDWEYAAGIAGRMFKLERVVWEWLSPDQLHKVQVALIYEKRKQSGDPVKRRTRRSGDTGK